MMNKSGKFITFEGSEGCGKTTQIELLAQWLQSRKIASLVLREPGGLPLNEAIRHLLKHDPIGHGMSAEAELLLFTASRAELVRKVILPTLAEGKWVLCDRFLDSTTVYQGYGRGLDLSMVQAINRFAVNSCMPDLTILLELDAQESLRRARRRVAPAGILHDRLDTESDHFFEQVERGYQELAQREPQRIRSIRAEGTKEEVFEKIKQEVKNAFPSLMD